MRADPRRLLLLLTLVWLNGCAGPQSALDPAGPSATSIAHLGTIMYVGAAIVTGLVCVLMLVPFMRRQERRVNRKLFLWGAVSRSRR